MTEWKPPAKATKTMINAGAYYCLANTGPIGLSERVLAEQVWNAMVRRAKYEEEHKSEENNQLSLDLY